MALGKERFDVVSGIKESQWLGRYWARWSDAVREAGLEPGGWQGKQHSDETLVRILADLTREFGHFPTAAEITLRRRTQTGLPNEKVFGNRLGDKAEQHARVLAFARSHAEYADVATICEAAKPRQPRPKPAQDESVVTGVVYLIRMGEFHKIGKSNDPGRRVYELGLEAYWHRRFAAQRANGEWFRLSPSDVTAFRRRSYM